jgi:hypothetical protein
MLFSDPDPATSFGSGSITLLSAMCGVGQQRWIPSNPLVRFPCSASFKKYIHKNRLESLDVTTEDPFTAEDPANKWTVRQGFHSSKGLLHEIFASGLFRKKYALLLFVVTLYFNV